MPFSTFNKMEGFLTNLYYFDIIKFDTFSFDESVVKFRADLDHTMVMSTGLPDHSAQSPHPDHCMIKIC